MENESVVIASAIGIGTTITAFFFGKSGIIQRFLDTRFKSIDKKQQKEEAILNEYKIDNKNLQILVSELTVKVGRLERELTRTQDRLNILVAYFEKMHPDGDEFIEKIIKVKDN